ncbi:MAG: FG-GAP repeat domain-containing protein, partial [Promethearchaeota archaeon]
MTKFKYKKLLTTTVLVAALMLSMYVVVPGANFLSADSNSTINTLGLNSSDTYNATGIYDWSNFTSFTYRIPLEINSTFINRTDYSVKVEVDFTQALTEAGYSGEEFDDDTVRVVEYEGTNTYYPKLFDASNPEHQYILPSLFIPLDKHDGYDATTNAIGQLWFEMPGLSTANENRTFMIYYDTIENTEGDPITDNPPIWNKDYNYETDVIGDKMYHLAYGSYQEVAGLSRGELTIWNEDLSDTLFKGRPHSDIQRYLNPVPGDYNGDNEIELLVSDRDNQFWLMDYREDVELFSPLQTVNGDPLNFDTVARDWILAEIGEIPYRWSTTHTNILAADMDHDGYDEIVTTTYDRGYNYIFIYNITQDGSLNHVLNVQEVLNTTDRDIQAMALVDFNFDGYLDIIGADNDGGSLDIHGYTLYFWINNGTGVYDHFNVTQAVHLNHGDELPQEVRSISCGDIDNDGNIEVVTTDHDNHDYLYIWQWDLSNTTGRADGTMEYEGTYDVPADPNFYEPVVGAMYDWDYDGYTEIIIGNSDAGGNSSIAVIEVKGDEVTYTGNDRIVQESEWGQWGNSSIPYHNLYFPRFGDVDNDGYNEMA